MYFLFGTVADRFHGEWHARWNIPVVLAWAALVWSFLAGCVIWVLPLRYLQYRSFEIEPRVIYLSFSEATRSGVAILAVPVLLTGVGVWLANKERALALCAVTFMLLCYCLVTGFSIGVAYVPAVGAQLGSTFLLFSDRRSREG
jgi:hypothetical protein